jgi:hypothetical protein
MTQQDDYPPVRELPEARKEREALPAPIRETMTLLRDDLNRRWPSNAKADDDLFPGRRIWLWQVQFGDWFAAAWERCAVGEQDILIWMYGSLPGFHDRLRRRAG